ncbi:MAG TPA: GNAT family N-acetyltransferase [Hyphomicrobiaceae bacterium]|jgi:GNAT superfamily N-acetyltransferase|nr:GNAT family N-acetyltransferase [Hyphomicrobiaceae bacterium]
MREVTFRHAESDQEVAACFPVMKDLRPHLADADELVRRVRRQRREDYHLLAAWRGTMPVGLAGYRFQELLIHGPFAYVDDLVVEAGERRHRLGARLLDEVSAVARKRGCNRLVLDTAIDNSLGQRFYFRYGMLARGLRFSMPLGPV